MPLMPRIVPIEDPAVAVAAIRAGGHRVATFFGFSGAGYEDSDAVRAMLLRELDRFAPASTVICAGATAAGIGMVYPLARARGFATLGIVSSLAQAQGTPLSADVETVYMVRDSTWGGGRGALLSPTSRAMVEASDELIAVGGGDVTRDELEAARQLGKPVRFFPAARKKLESDPN
jgi:hypothetical protein